ncbi:hypothetical protein WMF20_45160 [Sorangium sp. So ce834]
MERVERLRAASRRLTERSAHRVVLRGSAALAVSAWRWPAGTAAVFGGLRAPTLGRLRSTAAAPLGRLRSAAAAFRGLRSAAASATAALRFAPRRCWRGWRRFGLLALLRLLGARAAALRVAVDLCVRRLARSVRGGRAGAIGPGRRALRRELVGVTAGVFLAARLFWRVPGRLGGRRARRSGPARHRRIWSGRRSRRDRACIGPVGRATAAAAAAAICRGSAAAFSAAAATARIGRRSAATSRTAASPLSPSSLTPTDVQHRRLEVALGQHVELHLDRRAREIHRAAAARARAAAAAGHLHAGLTTAPLLIQQGLGRLPADDRIGHLVGLPLVPISGLADPAVELNSRLLLHDVRRLVRRKPQVGRRTERDAIAQRERARPQPRRGAARSAVAARANMTDVVAAERLLDRRRERQRCGRGGHPLTGDAVDRRRPIPPAALRTRAAASGHAPGTCRCLHVRRRRRR